jgi:hypothetical protein
MIQMLVTHESTTTCSVSTGNLIQRSDKQLADLLCCSFQITFASTEGKLIAISATITSDMTASLAFGITCYCTVDKA